MSAPRPQSEPTAQGEQMLVGGIVPITARDRLAIRAAVPLSPRAPQKPCDFGLFDEAARNQLSLF
jgi:hypothetical protein